MVDDRSFAASFINCLFKALNDHPVPIIAGPITFDRFEGEMPIDILGTRQPDFFKRAAALSPISGVQMTARMADACEFREYEQYDYCALLSNDPHKFDHIEYGT